MGTTPPPPPDRATAENPSATLASPLYPVPLASVIAPAPRRGRFGFSAFLSVLFGLAALVLGVGLVVMTALFVHERRERAAAVAQAAAASSDVGGSAARPELPTVTRNVPSHSLRVLNGCTDDDLSTITLTLADAIHAGAPAYNEGHFVDCYSAYVGAAMELERRLPKTCAGPAKALESGRTVARGREHASEQAWAMRDAFDGLLDVIDRSRHGGSTKL